MSHIFISYKHEDEEFIAGLEENLESAGFTVWTDKELLAGDDWKEAIDEAIRNAFALLAVMTPEARKSEYVTYEWSFAWGIGIKIIPIMLEKTKLHPRLGTLQYLDFTDSEKQPWRKLTTRLKQVERDSLVRDVSASDWSDRQHAARRLGRLKAKHAVKPLIRVLQRDRSQKVRTAAEEALRKISTDEALEALEE